MASTPKKAAGPATKGLRIVARSEGFRRAGRAWSTSPTEVALSELSQEQLEQLKAELALVVAEIDLLSAADAAPERLSA